jgi:N-acyl-D-amino-acid deacylase
MRTLVRAAMEDGALGVTTALIYAPNTYAKTPELIALAPSRRAAAASTPRTCAARATACCRRSRRASTSRRLPARPAHIYHFKQAGRDNWGKFDAAVAMVEDARKQARALTADMYVYTAGATGLDASMPPWVQDGGWRSGSSG